MNKILYLQLFLINGNWQDREKTKCQRYKIEITDFILSKAVNQGEGGQKSPKICQRCLWMTPWCNVEIRNDKVFNASILNTLWAQATASCWVFDQDDEIADPRGLTVVTTLVKWNLKADAKKDVCSSLAPLGVPFSFNVKPVMKFHLMAYKKIFVNLNTKLLLLIMITMHIKLYVCLSMFTYLRMVNTFCIQFLRMNFDRLLN